MLAGALLLSACGGSADALGSGGHGKTLKLIASFYPLQWVTQQIAGQPVASLTKPGAEPHDLELTPKEVAQVADADLVIYLKHFQPSVDEAVSNEASGHGFDVSRYANLDLTYVPIEEGKKASNAGTTDPHFWLDPLRLANVAQAIEQRLAKLDPAKADTFQANTTKVLASLHALDQEYRTGLASCTNKDLVTSHNAFGYLSQRYGMKQVGITGLTPDAEPSPTDLAAVTNFVRANQVHTIYYETLVSPSIADAVASETGARTEVLDPIEGLTSKSQGRDYLQIMRSNLANIRKGQPCT